MELFQWILAAVCAMASAAPLTDGGSIGILAQTDERLSDGSSHWRWDFYSTPLKKFQSNSDIFSHFSYSGSDGTTRVESNYQKNLGGDEAGNSNQGSVIWTSPEGKQFTLSWVADEMGFHPVGDHLPTPPPIPEEIAKMLATLSPNDADYDYWGFWLVRTWRIDLSNGCTFAYEIRNKSWIFDICWFTAT